MSTRTIARARGAGLTAGAAVAVLLLAGARPARGAQDRTEKEKVVEPAPPEQTKPTAEDDTRAARTLPPAIEEAIAKKEKEVIEARREGIRLLEDFLKTSVKSRE